MKTYEELLAERDALAACIERIRQMAYEKSADMLINYGIDGASCKRLHAMMQDVIPQQCLAEIKAEAAEVAYYNGFKDALVIEPPLPPATCTSATIDVFAYRVDQVSRYAASQYVNKIRNTGTWLKDSNVNGGKRQGGE